MSLQNFYNEQFSKGARRTILNMVEPTGIETILLDLGCEDGSFTKEVAKKINTNRIFGIDIDKEKVGKATKKGVSVYRGDLNEKFPMEKNFDVVIASHIIEHLCNTDLFLREIWRVLKPGGYSVISTPNLSSWHIIAMLVLGKQPTTASISDELEEPWMTTGPRHRRLFTFPGLAKLLKFHGFEVEEVKGSFFFPLVSFLSELLCKIDKRHSTCITIKARKV